MRPLRKLAVVRRWWSKLLVSLLILIVLLSPIPDAIILTTLSCYTLLYSSLVL